MQTSDFYGFLILRSQRLKVLKFLNFEVFRYQGLEVSRNLNFEVLWFPISKKPFLNAPKSSNLVLNLKKLRLKFLSITSSLARVLQD
jgi:hypothetical protein